MFKRMCGRVTFSNVIALMALFLALGGTVYAATKISGKQIKANSIPGNRVKKGSLTSTQIKDSSLTAVKSANAIARVTYQTATGSLNPAATAPTTVTATCPVGTKVLGGGATIGDLNNSFIFEQSVTADHSGYLAIAQDFGGPTTDTLTVTAVCAPVIATTP